MTKAGYEMIEVKVPPLGESVIEATISQIFIKSGSLVLQDSEILELETDKVNQVIYAPATGKLELKVQIGDVVKVGSVIGTIDSSVQVQKAVEKQEISKQPLKEAPKEELKELPKARKMADEFLKKEPVMPPSPPKEPLKIQEGRIDRVKMTKLRKVIAQKLVDVKNQTAMLTTFNEIDMSAVIAVRQKEQENFQKKFGVKLGFMSFFVKACVAALEEYPDINAFIDKDEIVYNKDHHISIAVSTERGLMVPVLRNVDQMGYADVEKALKEFAEKAKSGSISVDDLQGGTFTITNGGTFGSLLSTPILNPPQSGILGMHNIEKRPVVVDDQIVIRPMMYVALSYDHRIVDGKESIGFLMHIKRNLEDPARLLLDL